MQEVGEWCAVVPADENVSLQLKELLVDMEGDYIPNLDELLL
ncbi:MAG: hypothetical protein Q4B50_07365 [Bacillota bacterium]|nr:hypothetical protein [Bacillota bacterium]